MPITQLIDNAGAPLGVTGNPLVTNATVTPGGTQDVALTKINATATAVGNGVVGNGVQRVSVASDNTPFPVKIDQTTPGTTNKVSVANVSAVTYETVAASQTAQVLGGSGAIGDFLTGLLVTPTTLNPGNAIILDNAISITVFAGGTASVSNLVPFFIPVGANSVSGAWKVTTGADMTVLAIGNFT